MPLGYPFPRPASISHLGTDMRGAPCSDRPAERKLHVFARAPNPCSPRSCEFLLESRRTADASHRQSTLTMTHLAASRALRRPTPELPRCQTVSRSHTSPPIHPA